MAIYKDIEFKKFLELIPSGEFSTWQSIAEALNVDEDTITKWKRTPEATQAIAKGIDDALEQMKTVGKKDWRMWQEYLKMLGVNPPQKINANVNDPRLDILEKYGLGDIKAKETKD